MSQDQEILIYRGQEMASGGQIVPLAVSRGGEGGTSLR